MDRNYERDQGEFRAAPGGQSADMQACHRRGNRQENAGRVAGGLQQGHQQQTAPHVFVDPSW